MRTVVSKITKKYQATVPEPVRKKLNLNAGDIILKWYTKNGHPAKSGKKHSEVFNERKENKTQIHKGI